MGFDSALSKPVGIVQFSPMASGSDHRRLSTFPGSIPKLSQKHNCSATFLAHKSEGTGLLQCKEICLQTNLGRALLDNLAGLSPVGKSQITW